MKTWSTPIVIAALALLAAPTAWAQAAAAESPGLPSPALQLAPQLKPPTARPSSAPAPARDAATGAPLKLAPLDPAGGPVFVRADRIEGVTEKYIEAAGSVELRTRRETVRADWLRYDLAGDEVWGKGDVVLRRGIDWITGPEARYKRETETGFFREPHFYVGENGARGSAAELRFSGPERYDVTDARYTTCTAPREDWYIRMGELEVDQSRMVGTGRNATLYFLGAPIGYTPWFEFPLSNQRKSGFLMPTLGSSESRGFEASVPYYLNLAPDYDATITPRIMTKRGVQVAGQFRYLREDAGGEINAEYLNDDRVTETNRYLLSWKHNHSFAAVPGLAAYWNLNKVSDDTYFSDLSDRVAFTSQTSLPREGGLAWSRGPLSLLARVQSFQTLSDPTAPPSTPSYSRLPQVVAALGETEWAGFDFAFTGQYDRFRQSALTEGDRLFAYPTVAWSRRGAAWFFTARGGVHARHYALDQNAATGSSLGVTLPIVGVDAGLVFERDGSVFGQRFVQTVEPRAFYAWIPYRNQSAIPNFDSAEDDFNFGQLFTENRYLGNDRIGDANQLTLAVSSRFLDPDSGAERLRLALGQRLYFADQQVTLPGETPRSASSSDLLLGAEGKLSDTWSLVALAQINLDSANTERLNLGGRYTPAAGKVFNASYRYNRSLADPYGGTSSLKQFDLSTQWPLGDNWSLLGRWNYSLVDGKTLEGVAGVEYNGGCWVVRVVGQRLATTTQTTTTSVYAQLELNGLARFGTSPLEMLRRTVPGYQKTNEPASLPGPTTEGFAEF